MILTATQRKTFDKGVALANEILLKLKYLESLAAAVPELQPRVDQIRAKRDYLYHLSQTALDLDHQMSQE